MKIGKLYLGTVRQASGAPIFDGCITIRTTDGVATHFGGIAIRLGRDQAKRHRGPKALVVTWRGARSFRNRAMRRVERRNRRIPWEEKPLGGTMGPSR